MALWTRLEHEQAASGRTRPQKLVVNSSSVRLEKASPPADAPGACLSAASPGDAAIRNNVETLYATVAAGFEGAVLRSASASTGKFLGAVARHFSDSVLGWYRRRLRTSTRPHETRADTTMICARTRPRFSHEAFGSVRSALSPFVSS